MGYRQSSGFGADFRRFGCKVWSPRGRYGNIAGMSLTPPLVVPILAIPFGVVPLPDAEALNPALGELFAARIRADDPTRRRFSLCYLSGDDFLDWPEDPVRQLTPAIFRGVNSVVSAVNDFTKEQLDSFA